MLTSSWTVWAIISGVAIIAAIIVDVRNKKRHGTTSRMKIDREKRDREASQEPVDGEA